MTIKDHCNSPLVQNTIQIMLKSFVFLFVLAIAVCDACDVADLPGLDRRAAIPE